MDEVKHVEVCKPEDVLELVLELRPEDYEEILEVAHNINIPISHPRSLDNFILELIPVVKVFLRKIINILFYGNNGIYARVKEIFNDLVLRQKAYQVAGFPQEENRNLSTLKQAVASFSVRKISNGITENDGFPDGISLAHILGTTSVLSMVTEVGDDNTDWNADKSGWLNSITTFFPNATKFTIGCNTISNYPGNVSNNLNREIHILAKNITINTGLGTTQPGSKIYFDELETVNLNNTRNFPLFRPEEIYFPKLKSGYYFEGYSATATNSTTTYIYLGCYGGPLDNITIKCYGNKDTVLALKVIEVRLGARQRITIDPNMESGYKGFNNITFENLWTYLLNKMADNSLNDDGTAADPITLKIGGKLYAEYSDETSELATLARAHMSAYNYNVTS